MTDESGLFWAGAPLTVNSDLFHIYRESTGRSLCGRYAHSNLNETTPVEDDDTYSDSTDCKVCARRAGVLNEDDESQTDD